jgi:hypothetical protein
MSVVFILMRALFAVLMSAALAGCAGSPMGDLMAGPEKLAAQDDTYCKSLGAKPDSDNYINCRLIADQNRAQRHADADATSNALLGAAASVTAANNNSAPAYQPMPNILPPPPVRCRSVPTGYGTYQTVCQ